MNKMIAEQTIEEFYRNQASIVENFINPAFQSEAGVNQITAECLELVDYVQKAVKCLKLIDPSGKWQDDLPIDRKVYLNNLSESTGSGKVFDIYNKNANGNYRP